MNETNFVWASPLDFSRVEICLNPGLEFVGVNIDYEGVTTCLDPRKSLGEQVGQRWPFAPTPVDRHLCEGQYRLDIFVERRRFRFRRVSQFHQLGLAPEVAESYGLGGSVFHLPDQRGDGGPHRVSRRGENAGVRPAVGRHLARIVLVLVETIYADGVGGFQVALPRSGEEQPVQPGAIGDEADDDAPGFLRDALLRHSEEPHVQVVQVVQPLLPGFPHLLDDSVGLSAR